MEKILDFLIEVGKLKRRERRGWLIHNIPERETTASHSFRLALLAWLLAKKKGELNIEKVLKMALIHDICEVYTWDETPYDPLIPRDVKKRDEIEKVLDKWPTFSMEDKERKGKEKFAREYKSLQKLLATLPKESQREFQMLWLEFEQGKSKEGRFVRQADKMESYLQGMEYWKKYGKIRYKLWARWAKEIFHDSVFIEFLREVDERFQNRRTQQKKRPVKPSSSKSVRKA